MTELSNKNVIFHSSSILHAYNFTIGSQKCIKICDDIPHNHLKESRVTSSPKMLDMFPLENEYSNQKDVIRSFSYCMDAIMLYTLHMVNGHW